MLHAEQGALVAAGSQRAVRSRRSAQARGANFYPPDATREEVEKWVNGLPLAEREAATGFFTTIRRAPGGGLSAVPYSIEYQGELALAAAHLREAAKATGDADA